MNNQLIIKHSAQWKLEKEYEKALTQHEQLEAIIDHWRQKSFLIQQKKEQLKKQILDWEKEHLGLLGDSYFEQDKEGKDE